MKLTKTILSIFLFSSLLFFNGCDQLENFELNIPLELYPPTISGDDAADASETIEFCLNQFDEWNDNKDKIVKAEYLDAAYWTIDYSPTEIRGTLSFALYDRSGGFLVGGSLPNVSPGDYMMGDQALKIVIPQEQIDDFNAYLSEIRNSEDPYCDVPSFTAVASISDVTGTTGDYSVDCKIEVVLKAEVEP